MTNEEAIKIIKSECYTANLLNLDRTRMVNTALDLAIKALEQQTCENCISREAVLDTEYQIKEINGIEYVMLSEVQMKIRKMPSVIPKYTDEEIDKAQAVEQAYVDKMVELAVEELKTPKAEWKDIYAESEGSNSWIEFTCPHCGKAFGIESGQYGWSYGEAIPWKACPMCGGLAEHEPYKAESEDEE